MGNLLAAAGDLQQARTAYSSAVAMDPFDSRAHFGLAKLDEGAGRLAQALSGYRAGLETDPGNAQARDAVLRLSGKPVTQPASR
jgi:predicted TPR repeat methyltransferase